MHPSILREFHLSLAPNPAIAAPAGELFVRLQHSHNLQEVVFRVLNDGTTAPEREIEEQVMRLFPASAAAAELRTVYGLSRYRLRANWEKELGDRLYFGLSNASRSKGARFWAELIPTLPTVLYSTMTARAVEYLGRLEGDVQLRTVIKTVYDAWRTVLDEVRMIPRNPRGLERLAMDLHGWPTTLMRDMPIIDYGRLKEKGLFAKMALDYLSEEDWADVVRAILAPAETPEPSTDLASAPPTPLSGT